jgi:2,4-dienoyl-CoA reductase-like NADH-dependent reductase (Old Yellow Enzyme family)
MANLFSTLKFRSVELKNRISVSPMCQYSCEDGFANDWHFVHQGARAAGGAGLVFTEATAVCPEGRISPGDLGLWKDEQIEPLQRITKFIHQMGSVAGIQLAHAGRKASHSEPWNGSKMIALENGGWETVAPSPVPFAENERAPHALTPDEIRTVVGYFKSSAARALQAGYRIVEIHAAHGYLINTFLSPLSNKRTDEYGGAFENRIRMLLEVIKAVREAWPEDLPLFVRISATDWVDGGWNMDDSVRLAEILKNHTVDLVDCSTGGMVPNAVIPAGPGYQVPFAETIRKKTGMATAAVGIIVNAQQADEIISSGKADLVMMAREMLRDPYFALRAARELGVDVQWPIQYERAKRKN